MVRVSDIIDETVKYMDVINKDVTTRK